MLPLPRAAYASGSGEPDVLLRVPRPLRGLLLYLRKTPGSPDPPPFKVRLPNAIAPLQQKLAGRRSLSVRALQIKDHGQVVTFRKPVRNRANFHALYRPLRTSKTVVNVVLLFDVAVQEECRQGLLALCLGEMLVVAAL